MSKTGVFVFFFPSTQILTCFGTPAPTWLNAGSNHSSAVSSSFDKKLCGAEVANLCHEAAKHRVSGKAPLGGEGEGQDSFVPDRQCEHQACWQEDVWRGKARGQLHAL